MILKKTAGMLLLALTVTWLGGFALGTVGSIRTVTMVQDSDYPPFMIAEQAGPAGIYADIIRAADRRLPDYTIMLSASPWPRAKYLVEEGKINGLVGTYQKPNRRPWIHHYSSPLATETIYVYCRDGVAQESWSYPEDFEGLLFSNNTGFATPGPKFFKMVEEGKIDIIEEQTTDANLRLLQLGRADCYVQEKTAAAIAIRFNNFDKVKPVREVLRETAHVGYSKQWTAAGKDKFVVEMDRVLEEMSADGTIDAIIRKWTDGAI
jgi:polar amino acid transport system substrate-binding protein